jgi:trimeric autotransporter adhesin
MKNRNGIFTAILTALACFALCPTAQAVVPAPDGAYPGNNTAEGQNALLSLNVTTGTNNTAVGFFSLKSNVQGQFNTAVGTGTLFNSTAHRNTAIGGAAMFNNTVGSFNTAVGMLSLFSNTNGGSNTAMGDNALFSNTDGDFNTATGFYALRFNTSGVNNTANGVSALESNTNGDSNTATGVYALLNNTTGGFNTANGAFALNTNGTGDANTANGAYALNSNTAGDNNTANGYQALFSNTDGTGNTGNGYKALNSNTSGDGNTANGYGALQSNTGGLNTANGALALQNNSSGINNTALGHAAGISLTTGDGNVCIGAEVSGIAGESNTTRIRNVYSSTATARAVYVDSGNKIGTLSSSRRFKEEIKPMDKNSETLFALQPATFRYKKNIDPAQVLSFGLIAEEVAKINPELITCDEEGKPQTVRYEAVNAMLLNEFLKEHKRVGEQQTTITELKKAIARLAAKDEEQAVQIQKVSAQIEITKFATGQVRRGGSERPAQTD